MPAQRSRAESRGSRIAIALACLAVAASVAALVALPPGPTGPPVADGVGDRVRGDGADGMVALPGGPFLDVATLADGRLLAVSAQVARLPGGPSVRLIERSPEGWRITSSIDLDPLGNRAEGAPWLVEITPDRFAVLTPLPADRATRISAIEIGQRGLAMGSVVRFDRPVDEALGADVDGDGTAELVLDSSAVDPAGPTCQSGLVSVLDGGSLVVRATHALPNERVVVAAAVPLDDVPGVELAAYTSGSCPATPASPGDHRFLVLRLDDGTILRRGVLDAAAGVTASAIPPVAVDADGDGRLELLVRDGRGAGLSSARSDEVRPLLADGTPLGVIDGLDGRPRILLVEASPRAADPLPGAVRLAAFGSPGTAGPSLEVGKELFVPGADPALARVRRDLLRFAGSPAAVPVRLTDLDGDGCAELVLPGATWPCAAGSLEAASPAWAPSFLATTLLAVPAGASAAGGARAAPAAEPADRGRILVAAALGWDLGIRRLAAPGPVAAASLVPGAFRRGPAGSFSVVDAPATALLSDDPGFSAAPLAARATDERAGASVVAPAGTRILAIGDLGGEPPTSAALDAFVVALRRSPGESEIVVAGGTATLGASRRGEVVAAGSERLPVVVAFPSFAPDGSGRSRDLGENVSLRVVGISPLGEPSAVAIVRRGAPAGPPALAMGSPTISVPWPAETLVEGSTEPGSLVALADGASTATSDGRFAIPVRLPPWPTDFVVRTTAPGGETTSLRVSLVGGIDYRGLPLDAMAAGLALLLAVVGVWRASALRRRPGGGETGAPEAGEGWEIEELPPGR